jgi:modulator of FtsH protease
MAGWDSFFVAQVGASAALAGLVFVGISLNQAKIMASAYLPNRAQEALVVLLVNLLLSSLFLTPGQSAVSLGAEVLAVGLIAWAVVLLLHVDSFRRMDAIHRPRALGAAVVGELTAASIPLAGLILLWRGAIGVYWLVPGLLLSYIVALGNAWVLTVEINR